MTQFPKTILVGGLLMFGLGLPQSTFAVTGCSNVYLQGTYSAQITSTNYQALLSAMNGAGGAGSTGSTAATVQAGFGNNPISLSGAMPGLGRFYFDGNGNILGAGSATTPNMPVGTYSVNPDCSATMQLNTGQTFGAVAAQGGDQVMFIETDASGGGAVGVLQRSRASCDAITGLQTFAFSFYGAQPAGTGATGTASATPAFAPYSGVGYIALTPTGFSVTEWSYQNGTVQPLTAAGTYTVGNNCSLQLTFNSSSTGAGFVAPAAFNGIMVNTNSGLISLQTSNNTVVTGQFIAQ